MQSWYIWDEDIESSIGPVGFDELVARTWDGSITPDTAISTRSFTTQWQVARDVEVVGPLLEAVAAGRPPGRHWQRFERRVADGTLWPAMRKSAWRPWLVALAVFFAFRPWTGIPWWLSPLGDSSLMVLLGVVAQVSWYVVADIARDRNARIAARASGSGANDDERDAPIFVYDLPPKTLEKLKETSYPPRHV